MPLAVNTGDVAIPSEPETTSTVVTPPAKVPLATPPVVGARNVTVSPTAGMDVYSVTSTTSTTGKAVLISVAWGDPDTVDTSCRGALTGSDGCCARANAV